MEIKRATFTGRDGELRRAITTPRRVQQHHLNKAIRLDDELLLPPNVPIGFGSIHRPQPNRFEAAWL